MLFATLVPWIAILAGAVVVLLILCGPMIKLPTDIIDFAKVALLSIAATTAMAGSAVRQSWALIIAGLVFAVALGYQIATMLRAAKREEHPKPETMMVAGVVPAAANVGDAGLDLRYDLNAAPVTLQPGQFRLVRTGTRIALPEGTVGLVCPRSGLAAKHGIGIVNAPGVVDSGYRGDVGVNLINHGAEPFTFSPGDRIAQLVIVPFTNPVIVEAETLDDTDRGSRGFGSSGVR